MRVIDSFKNQRKRRLRDVPEIADQIERKRQRSSGPSATSTPRTVCSNAWGLVNFKPERIPGEDDHSIENSKKFLVRQGELAALKREQGKVDFHMDRTFADRRKAIIEAGANAKTHVDEYPDLKSEEGVSLMHCLIHGCVL